jgi:hypothetical protein
MRQSSEYRRKAEECRREAAAINDPEIRATYEEMARQWDDLAEQREKHGF